MPKLGHYVDHSHYTLQQVRGVQADKAKQLIIVPEKDVLFLLIILRDSYNDETPIIKEWRDLPIIDGIRDYGIAE